MLQIPQPEEVDFMEGCPVVALADDEDDLRCFLKALFDYEFFGAFPAKTTFDILVGVIRLSMKYEVDSLRKRALHHLSSAFPVTTLQYPATASGEVNPNSEWIRVVNFARETSLTWMLPLAMYRACASCTTAQLLNGINVKDVHLVLAQEDKLLCLEQSVAIPQSASAACADFLWHPLNHPNCHHGPACVKGKLEARRRVESQRMLKVFPLKLWTASDWKDLGVCSACKASMMTAHKAALIAFWEGLPQRFGLPEWEVLQQMKEVDLTPDLTPTDGIQWH
ncbi:hypothetical protein C8R43DRAFT_1020140 [Mycena crocata]|nr:hypothetical protein C8R43DRAFT_1020140 [Mycena crocata]